jgi:Na+/melibiose symporter-like transporter
MPNAPDAILGFQICSSLVVSVLFGICTILLICYKLNKGLTIQIANDLDERRKQYAVAVQ